MIDEPTKIGNTELYTVRVLNISVAQYYGVLKQYTEILVKAREVQKEQLEKEGYQAELKLYYGIRKNLNDLVREKLKVKKCLSFLKIMVFIF